MFCIGISNSSLIKLIDLLITFSVKVFLGYALCFFVKSKLASNFEKRLAFNYFDLIVQVLKDDNACGDQDCKYKNESHREDKRLSSIVVVVNFLVVVTSIRTCVCMKNSIFFTNSVLINFAIPR